jgi:hypothetical protein
MAKRVLLGKKGSDYGLFISKPGVDVTTTSSPKDLLFNSGATTVNTGATSERSFRSGVIVTDTTITSATSGATTNLPSTLGSDNNYYIPAYQIVENGVRNPTAGYDETRSFVSGIVYDIESEHLSGLPTNSGGGLWELTTSGSGSNINAIEAKQIDATKYENSNASSFSAGYPWISDRGIAANASVSVDILMLRIPCQYGKMEIDALFNTTTQPTPSTSGGGGSGGSPSAPTISSVTRISRNTTNDTVRVAASSGSNNSGTITYGVNTSNSAPTSFQSSTDFTQPRGTTRYYFAKQGGVASSGTSHVSDAVDDDPDAFSFTATTGASTGSVNTSSTTVTIAGMESGASGTVSISGASGQYSKNGGSYTSSNGTATNGDTFNVRGTASGSASTTVTVTLTVGGTSGTYNITTAGATDTTPDAFSFTDATGAELSTVTTSNTITISGIDAASPVSISGNGTFSIAGGGYTTSGNITNGQSINVRLTSSSSFSTAVSTVLTIGGVTDTFSVTTRALSGASTPTGLTLTQTTNTSASGQTVTATGSGGSGTIQVSNDGSNWQSNGHSFTQNRSGSAVTYYTRAFTSDQTSGNLTATKLVPPVVTLSGIGNYTGRSASGENNTYAPTPQRAGGNYNTYSANWGTTTTSISNNSGGWLSSTITNSSAGNFNLTSSANTSTSSRTATVTYTTSTQFGHSHTMTFTFQQDGQAADTTPNQFTFNDVSDATLNTTYNSNVTISGINTAVTAVYSGDSNGSFSTDNSTFNQNSKTVNNGDVIYLRLPSAGTNSTARTATITIGSISDGMTVTTVAGSDTTPNSFSFTDVTGANILSAYEDTVTITGINTGTTATLTTSDNCSFKVNNGTFSTSSKTVVNNDTITVRIVTLSDAFTLHQGTISVGGVSDTFRVTTGSSPGGGL